MTEILAAGGAGYLIPTVLFALVLYTIRGLFGMHGRRSQHRKEFMELWDSSRTQDDLWLEVAVRHLFGTYLPAQMIRRALSRPDKSQALLDLSELWPLLVFDRNSGTVRWANRRYAVPSKLKAMRAMLFACYFACASVAVLSALTAFHATPGTLLAWTYSCNALLFALLALLSLMREGTIKTAAIIGEESVALINGTTGASEFASKNAPLDALNRGVETHVSAQRT